MLVLGIESSCDECSAAVVEDGRLIHAQIIAGQEAAHAPFAGVVPEVASRRHVELILPVVTQTLAQAGIGVSAIDAVAATSRPGLSGSLLVGLSFAKGLALSRSIPLLAVDHIYAHLYAPHLRFREKSTAEEVGPYPYLGLLVSGGHTVIARVEDFDTITVLGTTIDDACGEAFDKVAKHMELGYPGGPVIDKLADQGDDTAYLFPDPRLHKGRHRYDVSYSGLKTAVINQREKFRNRRGGGDAATGSRPNDGPDGPDGPRGGPDGGPSDGPGRKGDDGAGTAAPREHAADIAASFRRVAIEMIVDRVARAAADEGISTVVVGGGVAANTLLRRRLPEVPGIRALFPPFELCTDNAAMIAGLAYHHLARGETSPLDVDVNSRVPLFRRSAK